jgi:hypothetical protein
MVFVTLSILLINIVMDSTSDIVIGPPMAIITADPPDVSPMAIITNPPDVSPTIAIISADPPDVSSLASRNPTRDIIGARVRPREKLSNAEKFTAAAKQKLNKDNAADLKLEISEFFDGRDTEIDRLAKKYNKSVSHIKQLFNNGSTYKNTREPSLRNALVHAKTREMNEGKH